MGMGMSAPHHSHSHSRSQSGRIILLLSGGVLSRALAREEYASDVTKVLSDLEAAGKRIMLVGSLSGSWEGPSPLSAHMSPYDEAQEDWNGGGPNKTLLLGMVLMGPNGNPAGAQKGGRGRKSLLYQHCPVQVQVQPPPFNSKERQSWESKLQSDARKATSTGNWRRMKRALRELHLTYEQMDAEWESAVAEDDGELRMADARRWAALAMVLAAMPDHSLKKGSPPPVLKLSSSTSTSASSSCHSAAAVHATGPSGLGLGLGSGPASYLAALAAKAHAPSLCISLAIGKEAMRLFISLADTPKSMGTSKRDRHGSSASFSSSSSSSTTHPMPFFTTQPSRRPSPSHRDERFLGVGALDVSERQLLSNVVVPEDIKVKFADVAALEGVKRTLKELVILPLQYPRLFERGNLRRTTKGVMLFGPPGTGKSLLAKAVAAECGATFLNITASVLTSKWFGESEKLAAATFSLARKLRPAIIFFDEVDALFATRNSGENEVARGLLNELMSAWEGFTSSDDERVMVLAATNRPFDIDDAVLRRLPKRVLIDVPDSKSRLDILKLFLKDEHLSDDFDINALADMAKGYTGSDLKHLCISAAYEAVRELLSGWNNGNGLGLPNVDATSLDHTHLRPVTIADFKKAMETVRPSVVEDSPAIRELRIWNQNYADTEGASYVRYPIGFGSEEPQQRIVPNVVVDPFRTLPTRTPIPTPEPVPVIV
mmetsp:Transcript_13684/g.22570  ORF Transcript_13684/g.22570 Transcript_13684/m.22570 type:complete len:715 (-) Transcript_13684:592-2736(-)